MVKWNSKICKIISLKSRVRVQRNVIVYRYIVHVICWEFLSSILPWTSMLVCNFGPTQYCSVCYNATDFYVTIFAVEHKKLRIRHTLLYVKL
jgi:hypothetical protein